MKISRDLRTFFLLAAISTVGYAQSSNSTLLLTSSSPSHSIEAKLLVGLQDIPTGAKGTIEITPDSLTFTGSNLTNRLTRSRISGVFVGEERVETGGFAGKMARIAIPFGGGAVLGTMTQKQVGFLAINYRDDHDGLRSAVFALRKTQAMEIADEMEFDLISHPPAVPHRVCKTHDLSNSIHVLPIQSVQGLAVVPEYQSLLYENLLELPAQKFHVDRILPDGERGAECASYTLTLTVDKFSKGNAALRASTGPAGLFVGVTKLAVRAQLRDPNGKVVLDKEVKASRRGDRESLNTVSSEAGDIAKEVRKANIRAEKTRLNR